MLKTIAEDIWVAEQAFAMGAIEFGGRMTIIRLPDASLLLYSPITIDDSLAAELSALGAVTHLVAPNAFHHLFLEQAAERFKDAKVYGPAALARKCPDLPLDVILEDEMPESWSGVLTMVPLKGASKMDELLLHHGPSQSLVVCDLLFHLHDGGLLTRLFFRMLGVWGKAKQSPIWRWVLTDDRAAAEASLAPIWTMDVQRVIMAHGRIIEGDDAKQVLASALRWMCGTGNAKQLPGDLNRA